MAEVTAQGGGRGPRVSLGYGWGRCRRARRKSSEARQRGQEGFTLIEVVIASTVLLMTLVAMGLELGTQQLAIGAGQAEQEAVGLLDQTVEQVRALPFAMVANGLSLPAIQGGTCPSGTYPDATATSDPNIQWSSTKNTWVFTGIPGYNPIPHGCLSYQQSPFNPHIQVVSERGMSFSIATYPSYYLVAPTTDQVIEVTVIVNWKQFPTWALHKVITETLVYSPTSGCLTSTNHPFAAPCQPFFLANALSGENMGVTVTPLAGGLYRLFSQAYLGFGTVTSNEQIEQTSTVFGSVRVSTASAGSTVFPSTGYYATSSGNNDPGTSVPTSSSASVAGSAGQLVESTGGNNPDVLTLIPRNGDTGMTVSTAAAATSQNCVDLSNAAQNTGLPCGSGSESPAGSATITLSTYGTKSLNQTSLGNATLLSASSGTLPAGTFLGRWTQGGGTYCTNTTGDGCVYAVSQVSLGTVSVGGLPSQFITDGAMPPGWSNTINLFSVTNFSAQAAAQSGQANTSGLPAPSVVIPASGQPDPVITWWNGTSYSSSDMSTWGSSPPTINIAPVNIPDPNFTNSSNQAVTVQMSATVTTGGAGESSSGNAPCSTPCTETATLSALDAVVNYTISQGATVLESLQIEMNLGTLLAATSYQKAPS